MPASATSATKPRRPRRRSLLRIVSSVASSSGAADQRRAAPEKLDVAALLHAHELVGRDRLRLALERERLDLHHLGLVAYEPVGQLAEQHLTLPGGLLEARRDVDGVAGHEPLSGRRVAGDDLTGVDAGRFVSWTP